jgi:hypothetical protein
MLLQRVRQERFVYNRGEEVVFLEHKTFDLGGRGAPFVGDCSGICPEESLRLNDNSQTSDIKTDVPEGLL